MIVWLVVEIWIFISWITISNRLSECRDNVRNFTNEKGSVELQSEPDPHHTNEDTDEILHWVNFSFFNLMKET